MVVCCSRRLANIKPCILLLMRRNRRKISPILCIFTRERDSTSLQLPSCQGTRSHRSLFAVHQSITRCDRRRFQRSRSLSTLLRTMTSLHCRNPLCHQSHPHHTLLWILLQSPPLRLRHPVCQRHRLSLSTAMPMLLLGLHQVLLLRSAFPTG